MKNFIRLRGINDAIRFIQEANAVKGDIIVSRGSHHFDGKSLADIMSIDTTQGIMVEYPEDAEEFNRFLLRFICK